jgi:hypothetical protein
MAGQLAEWHKEYAKKGLTIIDIDNGRSDTKDAVKKRVEHKEYKYAVLWDKGAKNCTEYGVEAYPAQYLVGVDGKVLWEGFYNESTETQKKVDELIAREITKVKREDLERDK